MNVPLSHESPRESAFDIPLGTLQLRDIGRWLSQGWQDFRRAPAIGLFYGACFVLMGRSLLALFEHAPAYVLALSAGFLLVGPFLCMGLYRVSQRLEAGQPPRLATRWWPGARAPARWRSSRSPCWCWRCCGRGWRW